MECLCLCIGLNLSTRRYTKLPVRTLSLLSILHQFLGIGFGLHHIGITETTSIYFLFVSIAILRIFIDYFVALLVRRSLHYFSQFSQLPVVFLTPSKLFHQVCLLSKDLWPKVLIDQRSLISTMFCILSFMKFLYRFLITQFILPGLKILNRSGKWSQYLAPKWTWSNWPSPFSSCPTVKIFYCFICRCPLQWFSTVVAAARLISKDRMPIRFLWLVMGQKKHR